MAEPQMIASLRRMVKSEIDAPDFERKRVKVGMRMENQIRPFDGRKMHAVAASTSEMRRRLIDMGVAKAPDSDGLARIGRPSSSLREGSLPGPKMASEEIVQGQ